ncbi:MAG TPA: hypothetical protein VJI12_04880 [archaeon]|nr:hypothetical protein [archaeon]
MFLTPQDQDMMESSLKIMGHLYGEIRAMPISEVIKDVSSLGSRASRYARKDKKDTLVVDAMAEDIISGGNSHPGHTAAMQRIYDPQGIIITEECGRIPRDALIDHASPVIMSDPMDSSTYCEDLMNRHSDKGRAGDAFDAERALVGEVKARTHACNSSVTLLKDHEIKYTIIVNMMTGDTYVGSKNGVFRGNIESAKSVADISVPLKFSNEYNLMLLCYNAKGKYDNNRLGTNLVCLPLHESSWLGPVGPMRFAHLIDFGDGVTCEVGTIAHNGEKIQESLPNIAIALFSNDELRAYKLFCDRDHGEIRGSQELTPNLLNSLYDDGPIYRTGIKTNFLNRHLYPSEFRDTTLVHADGNKPVSYMMKGMVTKGEAVRIV